MSSSTKQQNQSAALILASSSPYRRELLQRLGLAFQSIAPDINESAIVNESAEALVARLASEKALCVATNNQNAVIIGSDQVVAMGDEILTKPLNHTKAVSQLEQLSGKTVRFLTGLCVLNASTGKQQSALVSCDVQFRRLGTEEIERYLKTEMPYDCAGSFKSEGLGISLLKSMNLSDPTALIGLPLIRLSDMLRKEGYAIP